jgi:NAD(P)-dependent dehydrogenase (short-subunit alcohol dehydrogenase family)
MAERLFQARSLSPGGSFTADLTGQVAVVTGGAKGIGETLSRRFAEAGAAVLITGRDAARLHETADHLRTGGARVEWISGDVSKIGDVQAIFEMAVNTFGGVSILVNNAGIAGPTAELVNIDLTDWNEVIATNLTGVFLCCKIAIPIMRRSGGGKIVNIGSASGKRPLAMRTPYTASKLGLIGLTRSLAHEVAKYGINVNAISPWLVEGERLDGVIERMARARNSNAQTMRRELTALSPFGRGVSPDDVAGVALFLCSAAADNMTGQDINVTAGAVMY